MIRIVTDSSADLSPAVAADHRIEVVPLTIRFGDDEFVDRRISVPRPSGSAWAVPTPSPAPPHQSVGAFGEAYQRMADEGADGVVAVTISQDLSGTFNRPVWRRRTPPSRCASSTRGLRRSRWG